jgi:hypothetical protein
MDTVIINKQFSVEYCGPHMLASTVPPWSNITIRNIPISMFVPAFTEQTQASIPKEDIGSETTNDMLVCRITLREEA